MAKLPREVKKAAKAAMILVLVTLLVVNPTGSSLVMSLNSREFFSYHIKDIVDAISVKDTGQADYYLSTGTYEQQKDGPLFGAAKGRNLIMVQMESFQNFLVNREYNGKEITPELNALIEDPSTIYFDNFYHQIGSGNTSDAEFAVNNSMIGSIESYTYQLFEDNYFKGLPVLLQEHGYQTSVFHGYKKEFWNRENIYPKLGFQQFYGDKEFKSDNIKGIGGGNITGVSDSAFFEQVTDYMEQLPEPYYSFLITLSCHNPFGLPDSLKELEIQPSEDNIVGNYFNAIHYSDRCIGEFMELLKEKALYDNSIIVFYGDHFALPKSDSKIEAVVNNWLGEEYTYDKMLQVPMLIHIPGMEVNQTVSTSGGQIDMLPTLAYLLGFETLDTIYLGQNLLTAESGFVPFQTHLLKGSFIKDDVVFEASRDGVFSNSRAWNRVTGQEVDISPYEEDYGKAKRMIEMSAFYLYNDVLRPALLEGKTFDQILAGIQESAVVPESLETFYVGRGDDFGLADFYAYMRNNPTCLAAVQSDDVAGVLTDLEAIYSGKTGEPGAIKSVNEVANQEYADIKARIIPVMGTGDSIAKLEYLNYGEILYSPDFDKQTADDVLDFADENKILGLAMEPQEYEKYNRYLSATGLPTFLFSHAQRQAGQTQEGALIRTGFWR